MMRSRRVSALGATRRALLLTGLTGSVLALAACAVGPDFKGGGEEAPKRFVPETLASPGSGQTFKPGADISDKWWKAYRSAALDSLVERALSRNPSLEAAQAAIRVAHYNAQAQRGFFLPQIGFSGQASQQAQSNNMRSDPASQQVFSLFTPQLTIAYAPDIWGANARTVENLQAQTEAAAYQFEAAYITLASNVVAAAVQEASLRGQIEVTEQIVRTVDEMLSLLRQQYSFGSVTQADVIAQEAALAQVKQTLPGLQRQLAQQRDLLTALAGDYPAQELRQTFRLSSLTLPKHLPLTVPSAVLAQRPDIKAAEANLHAASAQVGVAVAARLPALALSANLGTSAFETKDLFTNGTNFYQVIGGVTQPVFAGFTLENRQKAAEAAFDQAKAQYRATVLAAFQNVADSLRALQSDGKAVETAIAAENAANRSLDIVKSQVQAGQVNQLALLLAQQTAFQASLNRVQAQATRLSDTAALFMALGGGWWNRPASAMALAGVAPAAGETKR